MRENRAKKGFTLMEMLVVIAIIAVLATIIFLFLSRNLDRSRAALNASNLRAARSLLAMELLADPGHPEEVLQEVLGTAPGAAGMNVPGLSIPDGTPMDAIITEDGVDTFYGDYNEENFQDVYQDGAFDGSTTRETEAKETTQVVLCGVLSCFSTDLVDGQYCSDHQIKKCERFLLEGEQLVPCGREYRDRCKEEHYMLIQCTCTAMGSQKRACNNCQHWHYRTPCTEMVLASDNRAN